MYTDTTIIRDKVVYQTAAKQAGQAEGAANALSIQMFALGAYLIGITAAIMSV